MTIDLTAPMTALFWAAAAAVWAGVAVMLIGNAGRAGRAREVPDPLAPLRAFLAGRDGEPDLDRRTLSSREAFFGGLARDPVRSTIPIDRGAYLRNLRRVRPEPGLDPRTLWLLASAKVNQAERFAVGLAELYGRLDDFRDPALVHVTLQETYHTRMLADVVAMFDLPAPARPPAWPTRRLIEWMVAAPERLKLPMVGMAEMAGCVTFRALRDRGLELFADDPAVSGRIRLLYDEILADELTHVGLVATQLGPLGRAVMRTLFRRFGWRMVGQMPEMIALFGRARLIALFAAPFRLAAMVAELPGRAYAPDWARAA